MRIAVNRPHVAPEIRLEVDCGSRGPDRLKEEAVIVHIAGEERLIVDLRYFIRAVGKAAEIPQRIPRPVHDLRARGAPPGRRGRQIIVIRDIRSRGGLIIRTPAAPPAVGIATRHAVFIARRERRGQAVQVFVNHIERCLRDCLAADQQSANAHFGAAHEGLARIATAGVDGIQIPALIGRRAVPILV